MLRRRVEDPAEYEARAPIFVSYYLGRIRKGT